MRALIVEDDLKQVKALSDLLSSSGYQVQSATNGKRALEIIDSSPSFDLVLLDNLLGDIPGTTVAVDILQQNKAKKIVIVSAYAPDKIIQQLQTQGVEFFRKPVARESFAKVLLVNDDSKALEQQQNSLIRSGYEVQTAKSLESVDQ